MNLASTVLHTVLYSIPKKENIEDECFKNNKSIQLHSINTRTSTETIQEMTQH